MAANSIMRYTGRNNKQYLLGDLLGKGGEGSVYRIQGSNDSVAKIYNNKKTPAEKAELEKKINAMIDMHLDPYMNGLLVVAWPQDLLKDASGKFA